MSKVHEARLRLRSELEAPPVLRRFGSGWISGVWVVLSLAGLFLSLRVPGCSPFGLRNLHTSPLFRVRLHLLLLSAFALSTVTALRRGKSLEALGTLLAATRRWLEASALLRLLTVFLGWIGLC
jgi:hypothetical protein